MSSASRTPAQAIAAWSAVAGAAVVIGPTLGGLLLDHFWWGSVFLINVPLVAVALAGIVLTVPETAEPTRARFDIPGVALVAGALFAIVDAIIEAPDRGWTAPVTLAMAAAGLAGLAAFVWRELRIADPLIDLRVFTSRAFSAAAGSVTVIFFTLFGSLFVLTQFLQLVQGYSPLAAGLRALPFALAMAAVSPVSPLVAARVGTRVIMPAGMALMGLGLLDLSTAGVHTAYPPIALAVAIMGAGMGLVMAPASTAIMTTVPAHQAAPGARSTTRSVRSAGPSASRSSAACPRGLPVPARPRAGRGARARPDRPRRDRIGGRGQPHRRPPRWRPRQRTGRRRALRLRHLDVGGHEGRRRRRPGQRDRHVRGPHPAPLPPGAGSATGAAGPRQDLIFPAERT